MFGTVNQCGAGRARRRAPGGGAPLPQHERDREHHGPADSPITSGAAKLAVSASMIANMSVARAPAPSNVPRVSTRAAVGSELSGTVIAAATSAMQAEEQVEPEDAAPAPHADEQAADHRAQREREPCDGGPDADRPGALAAVSVDLPEHRQGAWLARRCAQAHDGPAGDERLRVGREGAEHGPGAEYAGPVSMTFLRPSSSPIMPHASMIAANVSA